MIDLPFVDHMRVGGVSELISIVNAMGFGGILVFLYWTYRGLRTRIGTLQHLIEEQRLSFEAARERAEELDSLRKTYKQVLLDYDEMNKVVSQRRNEVMLELKTAVERRDAAALEKTAMELDRLRGLEHSIGRVPSIEQKIDGLFEHIEKFTAMKRSSEEKRVDILERTLRDAVGVLVETKKSFHSRQLAALRQELEIVLGHEAM